MELSRDSDFDSTSVLPSTSQHASHTRRGIFRGIFGAFFANLHRHRRRDAKNRENILAWLNEDTGKKKYRTKAMPSEWSSPPASVSTFELNGNDRVD